MLRRGRLPLRNRFSCKTPSIFDFVRGSVPDPLYFFRNSVRLPTLIDIPDYRDYYIRVERPFPFGTEDNRSSKAGFDFFDFNRVAFLTGADFVERGKRGRERGKGGKRKEQEREEDRKIINANEESSRSRGGRTRIGEINERMRSGLRLGERADPRICAA